MNKLFRPVIFILLLLGMPLYAQTPSDGLKPADLLKLTQLAGEDPDSLISNYQKLNQIKKLLTAEQLSAVKLEIDDNTFISLKEVSDSFTGTSKSFEMDLSKAANSILGSVVKNEVMAETDHNFILSKSVKVVVLDPGKLSTVSKDFSKYLQGKGKKVPTFSSLKDNEKATFLKYTQTTVAGFPDNHPLKIAMKKGNDALLKAIHDGYGEFEIVNTVSFSKKNLSLVNGKLQHPKVSATGFNFASPLPLPGSNLDISGLSNFSGNNYMALMDLEIEDPAPSDRVVEEVSGVKNYSVDFVAGFLKGRAWEWEDRWNFGVGFFRLTFGASYGYGIRLPLNIAVNASPMSIRYENSQDKSFMANAKLTASTFDADPAFYRRAGIPESKIFDGNEFVLEAEIYYGMKLYAFGTNWVHIPFTYHTIGFSQNFTPPLGPNEANIRFAIPANITNTQLTVPYMTGTLQFGINMRIKGTAGLKARIRAPGTEESFRNLQFGANKVGEFAKNLPESNPAIGRTRTIDYYLDLKDPSFTLNASLMPMINGSITIDTPVYSHIFSTGWIDIESFKINIGSQTFGPLNGTVSSNSTKIGQKVFKKLDPDNIASDYNLMEGTVYLRRSMDSNGKLIGLVNANSALINTKGTKGTAMDKFQVVLLRIEFGRRIVALKSLYNNKFVRAGIGEDCELAATAETSDGEWQQFMVYRYNGGVVLLNMQNHKFLRFTDGDHDKLVAAADVVQNAEIFYVFRNQ